MLQKRKTWVHPRGSPAFALASPRSRSRAASALAALLLGACGPGVSADPLDPGPAPGACGVARAAFCDTFEQPSPGGRGGDLDQRLWGVGRLSQLTNVSQGENNAFPVAEAAGCDGPRAVAPDGSDYYRAGPRCRQRALWSTVGTAGLTAGIQFLIRAPVSLSAEVDADWNLVRRDTGELQALFLPTATVGLVFGGSRSADLE